MSTLLLALQPVEGQLFRRNRARSNCPQNYQSNYGQQYTQPNSQRYAGNQYANYYAQRQAAFYGNTNGQQQNCQQRYYYQPNSQAMRSAMNGNPNFSAPRNIPNSVLGQNQNSQQGQSRMMADATGIPQANTTTTATRVVAPTVTGTVVDNSVQPATFNEPVADGELSLEAPAVNAQDDLFISPPENAATQVEVLGKEVQRSVLDNSGN
jgi:hypothetical protein